MRIFYLLIALSLSQQLCSLRLLSTKLSKAHRYPVRLVFNQNRQSNFPTSRALVNIETPSIAISQAINVNFFQALSINLPIALTLFLMGKNFKSLTKAGLLHATALGIGLWSYLSAPGWALCVLYFILGSAVTKVKIAEKTKLGIAEKREGARGPENVWGSAATAMVCAFLTFHFPSYDAALKTAFVASLATKLSDTFGSELGKAYGRNTYLITSLKMVPKGTEGAVSIEGTLSGVLGSALIALAAFSPLGLLSSSKEVLICALAAFIATTIESYIGAVFQDKISWLSNELVNLIMTVIGATVAFSLYLLFA